MYKLRNYKIKNIEPWNVSIEKRIKLLNKNLECKKIIYIYEQADSSTFRYRVYNMCQALNYSDKYIGTYFFEKELRDIENYINNASLIIITRVRWSLKIDNFIAKAKKEGIPVLFDVDDLVVDLKSLPLLMNTLNVDFDNDANYSYWFSYVSRLRLMASLCDGFISTNEFLNKKISNLFNKPVFAISNFLNEEQIKFSYKLFKEKTKLKSKKPFVIGYFSGTPSHVNDFRLIASEIEELLRKYNDMVLEIVGYMELPDYLNELVNKKRIIHSNFVDFITLQKKIAEVDVNIVPLINNKFTNCKSELKFFEAAIVGTITCATPTFTYRKAIRQNKTGFLCEEGEWYSTIEKIYKKNIDNSVVSSGQKYCLTNYSPQQQLINIEKILNKVIKK